MTPKARREQQYARESASRRETEAAINDFKAGQAARRPTNLASRRKTRKHAARCFGCDASGFPLEVWEYHEVASGPSILCKACSVIAECALRTTAKSGSSRPAGIG